MSFFPVPIMKTVVHIKKIFQAIRSPSSHLASAMLEGTKRPRKLY